MPELLEGYVRPTRPHQLYSYYGRHPFLMNFIGGLAREIEAASGEVRVWDVGLGRGATEPFELASHLEGTNYHLVGVDFEKSILETARAAVSAGALKVPFGLLEFKKGLGVPLGFFENDEQLNKRFSRVPLPEGVRRRLSFIHADALFENPSVRPNLIVALNLLQHYKNAAESERLLGNFASALENGGYLVVLAGRDFRSLLPKRLTKQLGLTEVKEPFPDAHFYYTSPEYEISFPLRYQLFKKNGAGKPPK